MSIEGGLFKRKLFCEPVTRPDGLVVKIYRFPNGGVELAIFDPTRRITDACFYPEELMEIMGEGDPFRGIIKTGQAHYKAPAERMRIGQKGFSPQEIASLSGGRK